MVGIQRRIVVEFTAESFVVLLLHVLITFQQLRKKKQRGSLSEKDALIIQKERWCLNAGYPNSMREVEYKKKTSQLYDMH